ncbi:MAG: AbgT family transporter [Candidatus Eisenbacteria bacterium]|nr:AbgT family transporter [Candidatus Eisenbacteria bacterium]
MSARRAPPAAAGGKPRRPARGLTGLLDAIERIGNRLPDPISIFLIMAALVLVISWLAARLHVTAIHPKDGSLITAVNLLDREGIRRMFTEAVRNFTGFAPLGIVLVAMIGVGVAERTGLIALSLRAFMASMPRTLLTATVVFAGMLAHLAADAGVIILPPIGALLFAAAGRHPLAGLAAAFAGVAGAFSANVLPSPLDVLLIGFTQEATTASKLLPGYEPQVLGNYFFLAVTAPVLTVVGTWVTHRVVEPRLGPWKPAADGRPPEEHRLAEITPVERRGLRAAGLATVPTLVLFLLLVLPSWAPLRNTGATAVAQLKPFFDSIVVLIMILFFIPGLAYGLATGQVRSDRDVAKMAGESLGTMGTYIVLAFAAAQFVSYFNWSNLGAIVAISGASFLKHLGLQGGPLLLGLLAFSASLDFFITSASAKWAMMAPVFVPMFAMLGFTPECTQVVFRIGASVVNIITPCFPYLPILIAAVRRYDPKAGTGTLIAMMLPYSIAFLIFWTALLFLFYALGWPIGPGVPMRLPG